MKRFCEVAILLSLSLLTAEAFATPVPTLSATAPTQYENGEVIPVGDVLTYEVYCSGLDNGSYPFVFDAVGLASGGATIDIAACVQGTVGTYYFVATATSTQHSTESAFSNQTIRFFGAGDLGKTPLAPTLLTISMNAGEFVFTVVG